MPVNRKIIRLVLLSAGVAFLAGCAVTPYLPADSTLRINRQIEVPRVSARVYFQHGEKTARRDVDPYSTYCSLSMKKPHRRGEPVLVVSPGQFEIIEVKRSSERLFSPGSLVASIDKMYYPPNYLYKVVLLLRSAEQPNVRALICEKRVEKFAGYYATSEDYPSLATMGVALGDLIEIDTP